ncbi:hypothetical protein [Bradyrhizobium japonicum]|uniref:hypothetical protein n=2 Tax=Nitrobacteraceae TaxID=41294 RepID=UPI00138AEDAD|nr:hypothetical protein [Bradyrhizobium japonicum]
MAASLVRGASLHARNNGGVMTMRRQDIHAGMRMTSAGGRVEDPRRARIAKGVFLQGAPIPLGQKYPLMTEQLKVAGPLAGPAFEHENAEIKELTRRLRAVREQLDEATRKRK